MRVLLLGADTPIGHSLRAFIPPLQRHELFPVSLEATRWKRERQVKKQLRTVDPDIIVDARLISLMDGPQAIGQPDLERTAWLADLSARHAYRYFLLSSSRVFSGALKRPYKESDEADATDDLGSLLRENERLLSDRLDALFVLRLGWVFSGRGPSAFNRLLDRLRAGRIIHATDNRRDCPVHTAEVARVIAGILDQMSVGAPANGLYHYGSEGDTGYFAFVEALVACASQFDVFSSATDLLLEEPDSDQIAVNRSLECTAIRHQFGIQRRPWRDFIERAVRRYIELYCKEEGS